MKQSDRIVTPEAGYTWVHADSLYYSLQSVFSVNKV